MSFEIETRVFRYPPTAELAASLIRKELKDTADRLLDEHSKPYGSWSKPWYLVPVPEGWKVIGYRKYQPGDSVISLWPEDYGVIIDSQASRIDKYIIVERITPKRIVFTQVSTTPRRAEAGEWIRSSDGNFHLARVSTSYNCNIFACTEE